MKKYELTNETRNHYGTTLYRIRALRDIPRYGVKEGDMGGFLEKESNLSQEGGAWVYDNARVSGDARVYDNAWVSGNARVSGNALVSGYARVSGNAQVYGNAQVCGNARVSGNAQVYGNARVSGYALVSGYAWVSGYARIEKLSDLFNITHIRTMTVTPQNVTIGCTTLTHKEALKMKRAQATKRGLEKELFTFFKRELKSGIAVIKSGRRT
jgi:carbonic anhydrase/acetyltransferase-like protein (isoleucine patch superfamily)